MTDACPNARALSDAHARRTGRPSAAEDRTSESGRGDVALAAHAERCDACKKEWAMLSEIRTVARAFPYRPLSADRARAVRAQIVMATRTAKRRPGRRAYLAAAAAVLMIALGFGSVMLRSKPDEREFLATVTSLSGSRPRRVSMSEGGLRREVVTLVSGRMDVEVAKLSPGERFLVITDDAEVEVRGTRFEVEAQGGILREVTVTHGLVEVRPRDRATVLLSAGERWIRQEPVVAPTPVPHVEPGPLPKPKQVRRAKKPERKATEAERAFQEGWTAYREGRTKEAAKAFERVMELAPNTPIAEDAKYWRERAMSAGGGF